MIMIWPRSMLPGAVSRTVVILTEPRTQDMEVNYRRIAVAVKNVDTGNTTLPIPTTISSITEGWWQPYARSPVLIPARTWVTRRLRTAFGPDH
jgi:hypothetical protein